MKNPSLACETGAFRVTLSATVASRDNATPGRPQATPSDQRYRWCPRSNSVQRMNIREGRVVDV